MVDRTPLRLEVCFAPHHNPICDSYVTEAMGSKNEDFPFGSIEQTVDMTRSRSVEFLIGPPEVKDYLCGTEADDQRGEWEPIKFSSEIQTVALYPKTTANPRT